MKKVMLMVSVLMMVVMLVACGGAGPADYSTSDFEAALNNGVDVRGKTVSVKVNKLEPNSSFGYNIQAGKHLNFVNPTNPGVKEGDVITVRVEEVANMFGSWIITYRK